MNILNEFRKYAEVINITNKPNIKFDILSAGIGDFFLKFLEMKGKLIEQ